MKNILLSTDFSSSAKRAESYAEKIALKANCDVHVFHSVSMPLIDPYAPLQTYNILLQAEKRKGENRLAEICELFENSTSSSGKSVKCAVHVLDSSAIEGISGLIETERIDLVVMGTAGATGKIFGSHTLTLTSESKIPVLAIPSQAVGGDFKKIICAIDTIDFDPEQLSFLGSVAKLFGSEIVFVHVVDDKDNDKEKFYKVQDKIISKINYSGFRFEEFRYKDLFDGIDLLCKAHQPDLFVLIKHERGFFRELFHKSVIKKMVYNSTIPLLILHG